MKKVITIALLTIVGLNGFSQNKKVKKKAAVDTVAFTPPVITPAVTPPEKTATPLTEVQKAQLKAISKESKAARAKIESDTTLSAEAKKSQIKALGKEKTNKMKAFLSEDQIEQMKADRKNKKED